jgi:hypothetical protein
MGIRKKRKLEEIQELQESTAVKKRVEHSLLEAQTSGVEHSLLEAQTSGVEHSLLEAQTSGADSRLIMLDDRFDTAIATKLDILDHCDLTETNFDILDDFELTETKFIMIYSIIVEKSGAF